MRTDAQVAYENTQQFREYLQEKVRWELAHALYVASPNPSTRNSLVCREWAMGIALRDARATKEHKMAFGW